MSLSSSVYISRGDTAGSHGSCSFHVLRNCLTVFQSVCTILYSHQQYDPSLLTSPSFLPCCNSRPSRRDVMSHCDFDFQGLIMWNIFSCASACVSSGERDTVLTLRYLVVFAVFQCHEFLLC